MRTGVIVLICMVLCACGRPQEPAPEAPSVVQHVPTPTPEPEEPAVPAEPIPPSKPEFVPVTRLLHHSQAVRRIIALPGGKEILTVASDGILRWKTKDWSYIGALTLDDAPFVRDPVELIPGSGLLASISPEGTSIDFLTVTGKPQLRSIPSLEPFVAIGLAAFPDASVLYMLEGTSPATLSRVPIDDTGKVTFIELPFPEPFLALSPRGTYVALANRGGGEIRILTTKDDQLYASIHAEQLTAMAFSPDESLLVAGDAEGRVRFWDVQTYQKVRSVVPEYTGIYWSERRWRELRPLPETEIAVTQSGDGKVIAASGATQEIPKVHRGGVRVLAFSSSGSLLISGGDDGSVVPWDPAALKPIDIASPMTHAKPVTALAFTLDGAALISAAGDATASVWSVPSGYSGIAASSLATESDIRSRAAELEALRAKLTEKVQRIRPTREAFITDLGATMDEVKRLKAKHGITSYAETANVPRIRNALAEIAKLQVYIDELSAMESQFTHGIEEVTHLIKDINLDLRMLDAMEQKDFAALSARIQTVMKRNLTTAEKSIVPQAPKLPNLEKVWNALDDPSTAAPRSR